MHLYVSMFICLAKNSIKMKLEKNSCEGKLSTCLTDPLLLLGLKMLGQPIYSAIHPDLFHDISLVSV